MSKNTGPLPDWELVLSSAARLQRIFPDAVLVGGTAAAIHAEHRFSRDADHVLANFRIGFDEVLAQLESVVGLPTTDGTGDTNQNLGNTKNGTGDNAGGVEVKRMSQKTMVERIKA